MNFVVPACVAFLSLKKPFVDDSDDGISIHLKLSKTINYGRCIYWEVIHHLKSLRRVYWLVINNEPFNILLSKLFLSGNHPRPFDRPVIMEAHFYLLPSLASNA